MDRRIVLVVVGVVLLGLAAASVLLLTRIPAPADEADDTSAAPAASGRTPLQPGNLQRKPATEGGGLDARDPRGAPATSRGNLVPTNEGGLRVPPLPLGRQETERDAGTPYSASPDGIRAAVRDRNEELVECYEGWVAQNPDLEGNLIVSFGIVAGDDELARVRDVGLASTELHHEFMQGCVLSVFEDLAFESPEGGSMTVTYPLEFSSEPDEE